METDFPKVHSSGYQKKEEIEENQELPIWRDGVTAVMTARNLEGGSSIDGIYSLPTIITLSAPSCYGRCSDVASKSRDRVSNTARFLRRL
ncbi:hypothetical protein ANN_11374 [Periplaneta americana]|uniref:Uncharacterized protein n=1 Tax=Periplaneta americana TaxID=6978 RepID=A0ABQ8T5J5_PERAM|nr:hypothetical protein ANN_11374 [Periplaneta americana]